MSVIILFQIGIDNNSLRVLVDGNDVTANLTNTNETLDSSNTTAIERASNTSVAVTFASGVSVEVSLRVGLMSFVVKLPDEFMMDARGLLGNFDGNSTNEFVFRDGRMIPDSSTDREIHNFGQSCELFHINTLL